MWTPWKVTIGTLLLACPDVGIRDAPTPTVEVRLRRQSLLLMAVVVARRAACGGDGSSPLPVTEEATCPAASRCGFVLRPMLAAPHRVACGPRVPSSHPERRGGLALGVHMDPATWRPDLSPRAEGPPSAHSCCGARIAMRC